MTDVDSKNLVIELPFQNPCYYQNKNIIVHHSNIVDHDVVCSYYEEIALQWDLLEPKTVKVIAEK